MPPAPLPDEVLAALPLCWWSRSFVGRMLYRSNAFGTARVTELEAKLGRVRTRGTRRSPLPSSHPHDKPASKRSQGCRRRQWQTPARRPTRPRKTRAASYSSRKNVAKSSPCVPDACRCRCGKPLTGVDVEPLRHQVWESSRNRTDRHRISAASTRLLSCGCSTCGELPQGVPISARRGRGSSPSPACSWPAFVSRRSGERPNSMSTILESARQPRLAGQFAEPRRRGRQTRL